jgi:tetratricopeptide (TPR) repeat protein/tRNA A-37 threonylcarbamoyl transferase component Bud32
MPTSSPSPLDSALESALTSHLEALERAWERVSPDSLPPRWQDYLPPSGPCPVAFLFGLLSADVVGRIRAGKPALLAEPYFEDLRLHAMAGLEADRLLAMLVRREYRERWRRGDRARLHEYLDRYPHLHNAIQDLAPVLSCSSCGKDDVPLADEDAADVACPACGSSVALRQTPAGSASLPATDRRESVEQLTTVHQPAAAAAVAVAASSAPSRRLGRYEVGEEIARGGMGIVLRARDPVLNRDLAVKVLRPELLREFTESERRNLLRRFEEEAQITAQLQHPGIVPVHELGRDEAGLPFLVMKLVRGQTLEKLLNDRSAPAVDQAFFIGIFEQVCQAVAFAHAHSVLHRDLKPLNVMVGRFGEVQVMDWGLAKVLAAEVAAAEEAGASSIETLRTRGESLFTQGALGTWQYMSPEQANGDWQAVDERTDVFALGGILCAILTGLGPYTGGSRHEVRQRAQRGEVAETLTRLDRCGADVELVALAKVCLSAQRENRPRNAEELANRVGEYRRNVEQRLRQAERERAADAARAEERLRAGERERQAEAVHAAEQLRAAERLRAEAEEKARAERRARRRMVALVSVVTAALLLGGGVAAWHWQDQATRRARAESEAEGALREAQTALEGGKEQERRDPERWHAIVRVAVTAMKRAEAAVASASVSEELAERVRGLQAELDEKSRDSAFRVAWDRLRLEKSAVKEGHYDSAAAAPRYREAFREYGIDPGNAAEASAVIRRSRLRSELLAALEDWGRATGDRGEMKQLRGVLELAGASPDGFRRAWREAVQKKDGRSLAALASRAQELPAADLVNLADDLAHLDEEKAAEQLLREALLRFPDDFWVNHNLGMLLQDAPRPRLEEAVRYLTVAAALRSQSPGAFINLGAALKQKGQVEEAIRCYEKAIQLDPTYAAAPTNLGIALAETGQIDKAIAWYRKAIEVDPKLAAAHTNLGAILKENGEIEEAIACCRKAVELDPRSTMAHNNLGAALMEKGEFDEAIRCLRKAIDLNPKHASAHSNLGASLREIGEVEKAIASCRTAIELDPRLAAAHNNLGAALRANRQLEEAIACFRKAIELNPKLAVVHLNLGLALQDRRQVDEAIRCYRKAIELRPRHALAHNNLGVILKENGKVEEAIACYRKAIALDPKYAQAHVNLGGALQDRGQVEDAIRCYRMGIDLDPKLATGHYGLGLALKAKGDTEGAIASYRKAIAADPGFVMAYNNLGNALRDRGIMAEAIDCYRKAIALDPKNPLAHNNLGVTLYDRGDFQGAIQCYRTAIVLEPKYATAYGALGEALLASGEFAEARDATRRCLQLLPEQHPLRGPVAGQLQRCETALALNEQLPAVLRGATRLTRGPELLAMAEFCRRYKQMHAAAARFYTEAFAAEPKLAGDVRSQHRYQAACSAALAAAGQGKDAEKLDVKERQQLRQRSLDWLRADLDHWSKRLSDGPARDREAIRKVLEQWQKESDLAGIREGKLLSVLPTEERAAWKKLWADLAALIDSRTAP